MISVKYAKPEVNAVGAALDAVQSMNAKMMHWYPDAPVYQTSAAYEADE